MSMAVLPKDSNSTHRWFPGAAGVVTLVGGATHCSRILEAVPVADTGHGLICHIPNAKILAKEYVGHNQPHNGINLTYVVTIGRICGVKISGYSRRWVCQIKIEKCSIPKKEVLPAQLTDRMSKEIHTRLGDLALPDTLNQGPQGTDR